MQLTQTGTALVAALTALFDTVINRAVGKAVALANAAMMLTAFIYLTGAALFALCVRIYPV
jgi:hypothetical protein